MQSSQKFMRLSIIGLKTAASFFPYLNVHAMIAVEMYIVISLKQLVREPVQQERHLSVIV